MIRGFLPDDWPWILALNAAHETETSPLDEARLSAMARESCLSLAFSGRDAFLIAFDQDSVYDSANFLWFKANFSNFIYVDRIVVAPEARGRGVARALYEHVIEEGRAARYDYLLAEVNYDPPNPASDIFHEKLNFGEIGRASLANGKGVRYLARRL